MCGMYYFHSFFILFFFMTVDVCDSAELFLDWKRRVEFETILICFIKFEAFFYAKAIRHSRQVALPIYLS